MADLSMRGEIGAGTVITAVENGIRDSGMSCELVGRSSRSVGEMSVTMLVFEKYYMRASNRASLSVLICGDDRQTTVDAVGAGGGQGALFSFSWGAEEDFVDSLREILVRLGMR